MLFSTSPAGACECAGCAGVHVWVYEMFEGHVSVGVCGACGVCACVIYGCVCVSVGVCENGSVGCEWRCEGEGVYESMGGCAC